MNSIIQQSRAEILATDKVAAEMPQADICTLKPTLDLRENYFSVFGLQPACEIDQGSLSATYRSLQQQVHPDRFTRECERTRRLAQQQAAMVNTAYNTLKSPLSRAQYLLEMVGQQRHPEATLHDPAFLMQQMLLRERLDESADDMDALEVLLADVTQTRDADWREFVTAWESGDWRKARLQVDKMQFACKLAREIDERQARLLDD